MADMRVKIVDLTGAAQFLSRSSARLMGWTSPFFGRQIGATGAYGDGCQFSTKGVRNECYYRCG